MRPSKHLQELHDKVARRLHKYRLLADSANRNLSWPESDQMISYVTIRCLNTWAVFSRAYFLSCVLSPWRESGSRISLKNPNVHTFDDAINTAMLRLRPNLWRSRRTRRNEEPWRKPNTLIVSCREIGCSNHQEILRAFSIQAGVFDNLPAFRNFYAHRDEHTAMEAKRIAARQYSMQVSGHPTEILLRPAYGRPQSLILDWIDEINITVELLCY